MTTRRSARPALRTLLATGLFAGLSAATLGAQDDDADWLQRCRDGAGSRMVNTATDARERFCELRETRLPAGALRVDGGGNGGITVQSWDGNDVRVVARIATQAPTAAAARDDAGRIRIRTEGRSVRADGPSEDAPGWWSVSYRILVPRRTDLALRTHNGGLRFADLAGDVRGRATNGGIDVRLSGRRWEGRGLDAETSNGGVAIHLPRDYSAELEAGTTNGRVSTDLPVTVRGELGRRLATRLGSGGAPVRAVTTNGSVRIRSDDEASPD